MTKLCYIEIPASFYAALIIFDQRIANQGLRKVVNRKSSRHSVVRCNVNLRSDLVYFIVFALLQRPAARKIMDCVQVILIKLFDLMDTFQLIGLAVKVLQ